MLTYHVGDLFQEIDQPPFHRVIVIPHVANNVGGWGSGFVVPLGRKFPNARKQYLDAFKYGRYCKTTHTMLHLGNVQWVYEQVAQKIDDTGREEVYREFHIANMVAQQGTVSADNPIPLKYGALVKCMGNVAEFVKITLFLNQECQIHAPLFGSALAGGNWDLIEILIKEIWGDLDVHIHQLPGQELREATLVPNSPEHPVSTE